MKKIKKKSNTILLDDVRDTQSAFDDIPDDAPDTTTDVDDSDGIDFGSDDGIDYYFTVFGNKNRKKPYHVTMRPLDPDLIVPLSDALNHSATTVLKNGKMKTIPGKVVIKRCLRYSFIGSDIKNKHGEIIDTVDKLFNQGPKMNLLIFELCTALINEEVLTAGDKKKLKRQ